MIILAYLLHTLLDWLDERFARLRELVACRQRLFDDIRALSTYPVSYTHLDVYKRQGKRLAYIGLGRATVALPVKLTRACKVQPGLVMFSHRLVSNSHFDQRGAN